MSAGFVMPAVEASRVIRVLRAERDCHTKQKRPRPMEERRSRAELGQKEMRCRDLANREPSLDLDVVHRPTRLRVTVLMCGLHVSAVQPRPLPGLVDYRLARVLDDGNRKASRASKEGAL